MEINLELVYDQLTEAICNKDEGNHKVRPIIDTQYDNEFLGWQIVRCDENGNMIPQLGTQCKTLKELFENFYENYD